MSDLDLNCGLIEDMNEQTTWKNHPLPLGEGITALSIVARDGRYLTSADHPFPHSEAIPLTVRLTA